MGNGLSVPLTLPHWNGSHLTLQICSTISEWEHIAERFDNATHYSEKALYKLLKNHVVPAVMSDLRVGKPTAMPFFLVDRLLGN